MLPLALAPGPAYGCVASHTALCGDTCGAENYGGESSGAWLWRLIVLVLKADSGQAAREARMETFMLAGCADDPEYAHAELIGDLISTKFSRVGFVKDMRHPCEWKEFRKQLVLKRGTA